MINVNSVKKKVKEDTESTTTKERSKAKISAMSII